jgi:RNA processing factor Prp31
MVMWSWGFNSPTALQNGLMFKVQGFIFKGWVKVVYNEGKDLFDVTLLNSKLEVKKEIEGIFFDQLVDVIDDLDEKTNDYENRVKQEYSLL